MEESFWVSDKCLTKILVICFILFILDLWKFFRRKVVEIKLVQLFEYEFILSRHLYIFGSTKYCTINQNTNMLDLKDSQFIKYLKDLSVVVICLTKKSIFFFNETSTQAFWCMKLIVHLDICLKMIKLTL